MNHLLDFLRGKYLASAIVNLLVGFSFVIFFRWVVGVLGILAGVILLIYGVIHLTNGITSGEKLLTLLGILLLLLGLASIFFGSELFSAVLFLFGLFLFLRGVTYVLRSLDVRKSGDRRWWVHLIFATLLLLAALYMMLSHFLGKMALVIFVGIALILDGVEGLIVYCRLTARVKRAEAEGDRRIYVESEEPKEE